jgi:hypothetical protein
MIKARKSTDARLLQRLQQAPLLQIPHRGKHAPVTRCKNDRCRSPDAVDVPVISTDRMRYLNSASRVGV